MTIDTRGYVSVSEAARRLHLSTEQIRRRLREGKLKGHRVANQWFVDEKGLTSGSEREPPAPLIPPETLARIDELRREANEYRERQGKPPFDAAVMLRRSRDED